MKGLIVLLVMFIIGIYSEDYYLYPDTDRFEGFVVGGVSVPIMMYPHVAQLMLSSQICGGSIISNRVILTAAHCVYPEGKLVSPVDVTAYIGSDSLLKGYKYGACKVVPHENYNQSRERSYYYYDLALILLKENIEFGPRVKMVQIADSEDFRDERSTFTIAGFGAVTNLFPSGPNYKLKATRMYYIDSEKCEKSNADGEMDVPDHMFCMIGEGWTSDCFGDSGSGIIWHKLLVGLVATGRDAYCGSDMLPSMYTDIVHFREWIMEKVTQLESLSRGKCEKSNRKNKKKKSKTRNLKHLVTRDRSSHRNVNWHMFLKTLLHNFIIGDN